LPPEDGTSLVGGINSRRPISFVFTLRATSEIIRENVKETAHLESGGAIGVVIACLHLGAYIAIIVI